ncbi:MAG: hypothetical protein LBQ02_01480 [Candidatus Nomurabacteria bacterium]|jgi:deoxycytidylate deaminase|nr:hypothetical protein [Candidatus Nomurabacteria bacterium]
MKAKDCFELAAEQARKATCKRARCGSVIITDDTHEVIGVGHNGPPLGDESQRTCEAEWDLGIKPKYDKTCCIHAEWRAIFDVLKTNADKISRATLWFMRVDENGEWTDAGEPFCTVCSRLALESGLANFALWVDGKPKIYTTADYNKASYAYYKKA